MKSKKETSLDITDIMRYVSRRLKKYEKLDILEQFAMFMGLAQFLEIGLKRLLVRLYRYDYRSIEKRSLGWVAKELKKCRLRDDFIVLLESVVTYRNYIAHEFLANEAMLRCILGGKSTRLELRHLWKGIYEIEQIVFLFNWTEKHNGWFSKLPLPK